MKRKLAIIIGTAAFVVLAAAAVMFSAHICRDKDWRIAGIFDQPAEPLGIVCIGSSHAFYMWNPLVCYRESGIPSCMFGSPSQPVWVSLAYLDYALSKHKPEVVLFETYSLTRLDVNYHTEGDLHRGVDALSLGLRKARLIESVTPETDYENYYFNLLKYHSRWKELSKADWTDESLDWHGYNPESICYEKRFSMIDYTKFDEEKLSPDRVAWLDEIVAKCSKAGAKIVFFTAPCNAKRDVPRLKGMRSYCEERGIPYLDMNCREDIAAALEGEKLVLQPRRDFKDPGHANLSGSAKATAFLSKWIRSLHEFKRDYNNKYAGRWNTDVAKFSLYEKVAGLLDEWRIDCYYTESEGILKGSSPKDEGLKIFYPRHLEKEGKRGCQVSGAVAHAAFKLDCDSDGTVVLRLMAQYATDENGKTLPIKQDFASVRVNGKEQLARGKTVVENSTSPRLKIKVAKGDTLEVKVAISRHRYPKSEIAATLAMHPGLSQDPAALDAVVNDRNFARFYLER